MPIITPMESMIEELADIHVLAEGTTPAGLRPVDCGHLAIAGVALRGASEMRGEAA